MQICQKGKNKGFFRTFVVVGDACPIPLKIHVELAKERPQSKKIQFWDEWSKERESADYAACLEEYLSN